MNIQSSTFKAKVERIAEIKAMLRQVFGGPGSGRRPEGGEDGEKSGQDKNLKGARMSVSELGQGGIKIHISEGKSFQIDSSDITSMKVGETKSMEDFWGKEMSVTKIADGKFNIKSDHGSGHINLNRYDD